MKILNDSFQTTVFAFFTLIGNIYADNGLPNPSTRPEAQRKTIDIFANVLYWHTSETIDWAFTLSSDSSSTHTSYQTFSFGWEPGFSIGLGYNMEHDQWDTQASYTMFKSKASASTAGPITPGFLASRLSLLEPFSSGKAFLNVHYNMFHWDLGRSFLTSQCLGVRPFIGFKGGWITQIIHSSWVLSDILITSAQENIKHRFMGGGPKGGASAKYHLGNVQKHAFSFIGMFEAGYLWGHWSIRDQYIDNIGTTIFVKTFPRNFGSFVLHGFMGFEWDHNFDHDRSHFEMKIGYEIEDWLNQCQIFSDTSGSQNNDLILQGLNIHLRFDF